MYDLERFRERVKALCSRAYPYDDKRRATQDDLASYLGIGREELNKRLHGRGAKLTDANVQNIVRALAEWQVLRTQAEARELLALMDCPDFSPAEWQAPPLALLDPPGPLPPPAAASTPRHNLPAPLTSFIEREHDMRDLVQKLTRAKAHERLLTLIGAGGCGKTRLAQEVARRLVPNFPAGVWLVELADLRDPSLVPQVVAKVLGVRDQPDEPLPTLLARHIGDKALLLLLDNCEHLAEEVASLTRVLLQRCPRLQILATSQQRLRAAGERLWPVSPLARPARPGPSAIFRPADVETLLGYEAIQLFVARAEASDPTFTLTPGNAAAVATICARLDGIPLAIELAAARLSGLRVAQIAQSLDERFTWLPGGDRPDLPHHQTLKAMVDWSYSLLNPVEQTLFLRLSVFAGGFALEAAEAVCSDAPVPRAQVSDLLAELVNKSLVIKESRDSPNCYRLIETLRQYGATLLAKDEAEAQALQQAHLAWALAFAEQAFTYLSGPEQKEWLDRLEAEHDNLRAALAYSKDYPNEIEAGLRLGVVLWQFWLLRDYLSEGRRQLEDLLALGPDVPAALRASVLFGLANLAYDQDDMEQARELLEECLRLRRGLGDPQRLAYALDSLSRVVISMEEYEQARPLLQESLEWKRQLGLEQETAMPLFYLGRIAHYQGLYDEAKLRLEEVRAHSKAAQNNQWLAATLLELSGVAQDEGHYERAQTLLAESRRLAEELKHRKLKTRILYTQGQLAFYMGDYDRAAAYYQESLDLAQDQQYKDDKALVLRGQGALAQQQGDLDEAIRLHRRSLSLAHALRYRREVATSIEALAALVSRQQPQAAARWLGAAAGIRDGITVPLPSAHRPAYDAVCAAIRDALGPVNYTAEWEAGYTLPLKQVVDEALADLT